MATAVGSVVGDKLVVVSCRPNPNPAVIGIGNDDSGVLVAWVTVEVEWCR